MSNIPYNIISASQTLSVTGDPSICNFPPVYLILKHFYAPSATVTVLGLPVAADSVVIKSSKAQCVDLNDAASTIIAVVTTDSTGKYRRDWSFKEVCSLGNVTAPIDFEFTDSQGRAITFASSYFYSFELSQLDSSAI